MKLIDLLVRELPKHGGWPDGVKGIEQNPCGCLLNCVLPRQPFLFDGEMFDMCDDWKTTVVTREQYEAAIAAAQQPVWNGEGLPPVGCECEFYNGGRYYTRDSSPQDGQKVKVVHHEISGAGIPCAVFVWVGDDKSVKSEAAQAGLFRPIQSEADKKRDEAGLALYHAINWNAEGEIATPSRMEDYKKAYDAIASGKIPHIQLK